MPAATEKMKQHVKFWEGSFKICIQAGGAVASLLQNITHILNIYNRLLTLLA